MTLRDARAVAVPLLVTLCILLAVAFPALATKTVSTSDGVTLTLTDTGAFSSLTVNGNTVPTLAGVNGGFYIIPMDGVAIDPVRHTYYPGTQITGTATQNGSNVTITGTAQNQTFSITLTGGLPYIKVDGTVTGNGSDHAFLVDFRIPVNANGWAWANRVNSTQTIDTSSNSNWYFANIGFHWQWHPQLSENPYGTVTAYNVGGVPNMGLSLTPLFYPPSAYAIEYNAQTGLFIQFEVGTTSKTTKHPNTADFHFVLYQHAPKWGNRSAVQRFQSFFPDWFNRTVSGGNWFVDTDSAHANFPSSPSDFRLKFCEGPNWDNAVTQANGILTMRYNEPWCWHVPGTDVNAVWPDTYDIAANWNCSCPRSNRGYKPIECAQADFNSNSTTPNGTLIGPDNGDLWTDYSSNGTIRWSMNPDPEIGNWQLFTPGTTRAGNAEFREWYYQWGTPPSAPGDIFTGLYYDSTGGYWAGWGVVHNFNPQHWPYYDFSPGIFWSSMAVNGVNYGDGLVCMWAPMSNVEFMKYAWFEMRKENRPIMANMGPSYESFMCAPWLDMWGIEASLADVPMTEMAMERVIAGTKPLSFLHTREGYNLATDVEMKKLLPYAIYPGCWVPDMSVPATAAEFNSLRSTYQTYMPIFDTLDAAGWNPIPAAAPTDTTEALERFGPNAAGEIFYALYAPNAGTATVTVYYADLGWSSNPNVTVTALLGAAPSTSYSNGNLVLSFGSITAGDARVVKIVYNGTPTLPVAAFTANNTTVAVNTAVNFTDQSTHSPTAWYWDFGDGSISLSQSPSHTYTAGGKYIVSLTAINATGQSTCTKNQYITVTAAPVASFSWYRTRGIVGVETTAEFHDRSTNTPTAWSWNFGDGNTSTAQNPTHTYTAVGTYGVSLTAYNASGNNNSSQPNLVTIIPIKANFSATPTFGIPTLAVTFTDLSAGTPTSWSWAFGDGGTSTAQNPSHNYTSAGYYSPSLTVTNALGSNTQTQNNYITVCTEVIVYPSSYSMDVPVGGNQHLLSGSVSNLQSADGNCMVFTSDTSGPNKFCEFKFYATSGYTQSQVAGAMVEYRAMSSNGTDTVARPSWEADCYIYPFPNTLTTYSFSVPAAKAVGSDGSTQMSVCNSLNTPAPINVSVDLVRFHLYLKPGGGGAAPVANFTGNPTTGTVPLTINFTDTSTNTPTSWSWTFGDSSTSTAQNPSHTYNSTGTYTVALTATNSYGNNTNTKPSYIAAGNAPVANFSGTPLSGNAPLAVTFTDSSTNTPTAWSWNFGDSNTSVVQNPSHTYSAGTYTVSLTAYNAYGNNTNTKTNYVTATGGSAPVANFSGTPTIGAPTLAVTFTDSSTNTPTAWSWTFGDSATSTVQNPSHSYTSVGSYTVALTAYNAFGNNTNTKNNYITVGNPPVANFSGTPVSGNAPLAVTFTDSSTNTPTAWSWTFGDSSTSTVQNPSHTYSAAGTYTVALTATNAYGNNTNTKNNYITVSSGGGGTATCYVTSDAVQQAGWGSIVSGSLSDMNNDDSGYRVYQSDTADPLPDKGRCDIYQYFTTGYTPSQVSKIKVEYKIKTNVSGGGPTPHGIALNICTTDGTNYLSRTNLLGDTYSCPAYGTTDTWVNTWETTSVTQYMKSNGEIRTWMCGGYNTGQDYQVSVNVCRVVLTLVGTPPVANFSGTPTVGAAPLAVTFTDTSTNTPTAWSWAFGDSNTSTAQNPSHTYAAGIYTVTLTATNASGSDGETKTNYITAGSAPVANFSGTPTIGAPTLAVTFTDSSTNTPTAWSWTFGDSNTSTAQNPSHSYTAVGSYTVALTATNAYGNNTNTKNNYITVGNKPVANFSGTPTSGAAPLAVTFTDSSTYSPTAWSWTFGDSNSSTAQNPSHTYSSAGTYTVALTATNAYGNSTNTKNNYITAGNAPVANFSGTPTTGNAPLAVTFTDSSTNSPTAWSWTFGDSNSSTAQNPSHTYSSAGNYTVALTATNAYGNNTNTKTNYIAVTSPSQVIVYPSGEKNGYATGHTVVSGTLPASVNADDNSYFQTHCTGQGQDIAFQYPTSVTPSTVTRLLIEYQLHSSYSDSSGIQIGAWTTDGGDMNTRSARVSPATSDTWYSLDITSNAPNYFWSDNSLVISVCDCDNSITTRDMYIDVARVTIFTSAGSPPVAAFSGTPTTGAAPLAVSFTDSSTNTPTAWSWTFGDSATSTVQNPSHTYAAGTYTVTLTATNASGSDGETKTNYITATTAAPTYVAAGSVTSGTGAITPALPGSLQTNDILLLFLETANQAISISNQNGGTWTQVTNSPQSVGTAGGSNGTRLTVFWSRYNGTQGAPTTSDSGDHQLGRMIAIRGATTSGDPCNITAGNTESTVDTSGAIAGATTTVNNTLVVAAIATSLPDSTSTNRFSAWTNADLSSVTERTDNSVTAGNGGGLGVATGVKATAGAYTTTAVTCATSTTKAMMSIAVKP